MDETYQRAGFFEEFRPALDQFMFLAGQLGSEMTRKREHGEIEVFISKAGTECLGCCFKGTLICSATKKSEKRQSRVPTVLRAHTAVLDASAAA